MWSNLITHVLEKLNYGSTEKVIESKDKYFKISNPFASDKNPSCVVYKKSGIMVLYNADVNGKNKLEIWEWIKLLGFWNEYINHICQHYEISVDNLSKNKHLMDLYRISKIGDHERVEFKSNKLSKIVSKPNTNCEEVELNDCERNEIANYISEINLSEDDGIRPCKIKIFSDEYEVFKIGVCFDYLYSNFKKYRFLTDEKKYRFRADGCYDKYYTVRRRFSRKCWVVEAEKEAIIVSKFTKDDCFGISGTSIPNCEMLIEYDEIEVLLDYDKFYERSMSVYNTIKKQNPNAKILVRPKLNIFYSGRFDDTLDFGDFHSKNKLTSDIVNTGLISESDVLIKNNLKNFEFLLDKN